MQIGVSMTGCDALSEEHINSMLSFLTKERDKLLFFLGIKTGFRISELLSLKREDIIQHGQVKDVISVQRKNMKGKQSSRSVVLSNDTKKMLLAYNLEMKGSYLFQSETSMDKAISRIQAYRIIKNAAIMARVPGKIATHSSRKTFAKRVYEATGKDILKTQRALGHSNINSTIKYLSVNDDEINSVIRGL